MCYNLPFLMAISAFIYDSLKLPETHYSQYLKVQQDFLMKKVDEISKLKCVQPTGSRFSREQSESIISKEFHEFRCLETAIHQISSIYKSVIRVR